MELTKKKAIELSILKWEYIVGNNGNESGLIEKHPILKEYRNGCSLCEYHIGNIDIICTKCPLSNKEHKESCSVLYFIWKWQMTKESAQKVLDQIKNINIKEWN